MARVNNLEIVFFSYLEQLVNLSESCQAADSVLKSKELNVEVATLDSVLYIYHHRLSAHKPYLALKQVHILNV